MLKLSQYAICHVFDCRLFIVILLIWFNVSNRFWWSDDFHAESIRLIVGWTSCFHLKHWSSVPWYWLRKCDHSCPDLVAAAVHDSDAVVDGRRHHPLRRVRVLQQQQPQEAKVQQQQRRQLRRRQQRRRSHPRRQHVPAVHPEGAAAEGGGGSGGRQRGR